MADNYPVLTRASGTLTITQHRDQPQALPLGTEFQAHQVVTIAGGEQIDLTTNPGWRAARQLSSTTASASEQIAGAELGPPKTAWMVGANGEAAAVFELPVGLFYVTPVGEARYQMPPFLVTIPMTNPSGDAWLYDVQVFPKTLEIDRPTEGQDQMPEDSTAAGDAALGNTAPGTAGSGYVGAGTVAVVGPQPVPVLAELPLTGASAMLLGVAVAFIAIGSAVIRKLDPAAPAQQNGVSK